MILSFTENGEMPIIFLVMRLVILFGEFIQLYFSPNYIRDSHLVFSDVFSNEFFALYIVLM